MSTKPVGDSWDRLPASLEGAPKRKPVVTPTHIKALLSGEAQCGDDLELV